MTNHLLCQFNNNLDCECKKEAKESTERRMSTNPLHGISSVSGSGQSQTVTMNVSTSNNAGGIDFANFIQNPQNPQPSFWAEDEPIPDGVVEVAEDEAITVDDVFNHLERDR